MFNVAIVKLRDIIKYIFSFVIVMIFIYILNIFFIKEIEFKKINIFKSVEIKIKEYNTYPIKKIIPSLKIGNKNEKKIVNDLNNFKEENKQEFLNKCYIEMVQAELPILNLNNENEKENENNENEKENENNENEKENANKEIIEVNEKKEESQTENINQNPLADNFTDKKDSVKIRNETNFKLTEDILNTDSLDIDSSNIIIFHTHTCESYTPSEKYKYNQTGKFRTTDLNFTVSRVGDELTTYLTKYNFNVIHDKTIHDYPAFSGSYNRSYSTVSKILENNKADIIIDLHRDAIGNYSSYAPIVKIGDDCCAQLMFVMGTNGGGLTHNNWQSNLKFAIKVQEEADKIYPGLFKAIILRNSRYNQNLGKSACIIEVGSTGNTLEQCLCSMKYFSEVLNITFGTK